jgi:septal ring factor EnvC (AmiA/AmiB activator)
MTLIPPVAAATSDVMAALGTLGTTAALIVAGVISLRKAPGESRLNDVEIKVREQARFLAQIEDLDRRLRNALADVDALRSKYDQARVDHEARTDDLEHRIDRLEAQVRDLGAVPVA